ncbi:amidohydrolase [Eisenbergiella tayi]|jgi:predicted amidohydrolase YtcJ|uniref:amidohydrolase n=1 Tax=Eisenbergiella tayi TaxID=1432052 RepID=UPI0024332F56|nr:amidohydrolase family protein [Eisenbergiella tayi]MBS6812881.1 amidohydrolase family protein [Lachnospiraceae bacterium]MDT4536044.1 amidohydrolase family protein [Eisenbergiella tayi]
MKTLYYGGTIHTMRKEQETFTALGIEEDRIIFTGSTEKETLKGYDRYVDLEGMHVFPTLTDSHVHLLYTMILAASSFNLCEVTAGGIVPDSMEGVEARVRDYCRSHPKQKIISANQYILSAMKEKRLPDRHELDEWTGGRCMIIYNIDGHSSCISTALMKKLGLSCEGHDGRFSGEEHEFMQGKVTNLIAASVTPGVLARGIANFSNLCARYGISRVCAMDGNEDVKNDILTRLLAFIASQMDIDIRLFPQYLDLERARPFRRLQKYPRAGGCGSWELDGSVGSHSAAFYVPFRDTGEKGHCYYEKSLILSKVKEARQKGIQLSSHAIGEAAIDQIVDCYEQAEKENAGQRDGAGVPLSRIDHFEFPSREAVEKIKKLPVALTVQPGFSWLDKRYLKSYEQFLPKEKAEQQIPLKELAEAGVCICGSSDSPVQSMNPYEQMLGMVEFFLPQQSLTPYQALCTYTREPARMLGEEKDSGTLEVGKKADFCVMKKDFCRAEPGEIGEFCAEYMVKDGKRYEQKKGTVWELVKMLFRRKKKI